MSTLTSNAAEHKSSQIDASTQLAGVGTGIIRYGLALVLLWIGFLKFQPYEAMAIMPLIAHSPFMAWMLSAFGLTTSAIIIGTYEIIAAVLLSLRSVSAPLAVLGGAMASLTFLGTISFFFTTPAMAVYATNSAFPFLSMVGQFLIKDAVLLGAAVYLTGEAWLAVAKANR